LSLEKCTVVVVRINSDEAGVKADAVEQAEGNSTEGAQTTKGAGLRATLKGVEEPPDPKVRASQQGTTVVVGTGHASKGVA
jgi:hypothetical protein